MNAEDRPLQSGDKGRARSNWIARHWVGYLPLPVSFWAGGVVVLLCEHLLNQTARFFLPQTFDPYLVSLILVADYGITFAVSLWWWIGTWRANKKYRASNDPKSPWPTLVTVAISLSILRMGYTLWGFAIPQIDDSVADILEDPESGARGVNILSEHELEVYGPITRSVVNELRTALASAPNVRVIRLSSLGGRSGAAFEMAALVKEHSSDTTVRTECDSACTIIFLAGKHHCVGRYARLGFHSFAFAGEAAANANEIVRKEMEEAGVQPSFIDRALSTPPDSVFYPDFDQLQKGDVLTCAAPAD